MSNIIRIVKKSEYKETDMLEERYVYTVKPKKPIPGIIKGKLINRPQNLSLSKEEVLECIKYGPVYRKFYLDSNMEMVTPSNIDRLHRSRHLSELEYSKLISSQEEEVIEEEKEVQEPEDITEDEPVEEVIEEVVEEEEPVIKKEEEEQLPIENEDDQASSEPEQIEVVDLLAEPSVPKKKTSSRRRKKKTTTEDEDAVPTTAE